LADNAGNRDRKRNIHGPTVSNWNVPPMRLERPRSPDPAARHVLSRVLGDWDGDDAGRRRILLLTSGLGLGHVRAAQAIEAALDGSATVRTLDLWSLMHPGVAQAVHQTYLSLVQNYPQLYERLYTLDEHTWRQILESESGPPPAVLEVLELISRIAADVGVPSARSAKYASDRMLFSLLYSSLPYDANSLAGNGVRARLVVMKWCWMRLIRRLEPAIRRFAPDVIVSTQMIPAAMASYLKQRRKVTAPLIGVMTDFGVHDFWKQRGVDRYCVAHESILGSVGPQFPHAMEIATGVPLMPDFMRPLSQADARHELQLPQAGPIVLVLGGGLGLSVDAACGALIERKDGPRLIAMPGRNGNARSALDVLARKHPDRLHVCEWTERMDIYLRAADVVVGKPGGISVAEALACGRPLLATRSLGGQEGFNIAFLQSHDVGGLVADRELLDRLAALLQDSEALHAMQMRAWQLGRREGARRVAQLAVDLATSSQSALYRSP
jgi:processive 1,2-diacylglycerol beta-glucosyltransferase